MVINEMLIMNIVIPGHTSINDDVHTLRCSIGSIGCIEGADIIWYIFKAFVATFQSTLTVA